MKRSVALLSCLGLLSGFSSSSLGVNFTWQGVSTDWQTGNNWAGGQGQQLPGAADVAIFSTLGNNRSPAPTIASAASIGTLQFDASGAAFTIGGAGPLTVAGIGGVGLVNNNTTVTETLAVSTINIGTSQSWNNNGTLVVSGGTINLGANTLTLGGSGTTTISDSITGTGGLSKQGSGTLTLTGTETYSGATTVSAGSLVLGTPQILAGDLNLNGGTLVANATGVSSFGALNVNGTSTINLTGSTADLSFTTANWAAGTLNVLGWTGFDPNSENPSSGTGAQIFITSETVGTGFLENVQFAGYPSGAILLSGGELVPVPEPSTYAVVFGLGLLGFAIARRRMMATA